MNKHLEAISNLKDGEVYEWSDYANAEVWYRNRRYDLYAIPMYGGEPVYEQSVDTAADAVAIVSSWT